MTEAPHPGRPRRADDDAPAGAVSNGGALNTAPGETAGPTGPCDVNKQSLRVGATAAPPAPNPSVRHRVRIRFTKPAEQRYLGHRDIARCFERWLRRAGLALRMSEGFHPKPRMSFPSALAVGVVGDDEVMEIELVEVPADLSDRLAATAPPGLRIRHVQLLAPGAAKAQARSYRYEIRLPEHRQGGLAERIGQLLADPARLVPRIGRDDALPLGESVEEVTFSQNRLCMRLRASTRAQLGPRDVLAALELSDLEQSGEVLARTAVELEA